MLCPQVCSDSLDKSPAMLAQSDLSKVGCKFACKRFVNYLVLAQEIKMYLRSFQICLSTDSLMIKEISSCKNASLSCELDTYLRNSVLLLSYITLQLRSFASSYSSYPSPPRFYIPERLDWSPSPTKLSSSVLQGQLTSLCNGHIQSTAVETQFQKLKEHRAVSTLPNTPLIFL